MPWTSTYTWTAGETVTATKMNEQLRDNMGYVHSGKPISIITRQGSSDYTTSSATFTAVDTTNLRITLTVTTGRVIVMARGHWSHSSSTGQLYADFLLDGGSTKVGGTNGLTQQEMGSIGTASHEFSIFGVFTSLSSGSHTFDLGWRTSGATATMLNNAEPIIFMAYEV